MHQKVLKINIRASFNSGNTVCQNANDYTSNIYSPTTAWVQPPGCNLTWFTVFGCIRPLTPIITASKCKYSQNTLFFPTNYSIFKLLWKSYKKHYDLQLLAVIKSRKVYKWIQSCYSHNTASIHQNSYKKHLNFLLLAVIKHEKNCT